MKVYLRQPKEEALEFLALGMPAGEPVWPSQEAADANMTHEEIEYGSVLLIADVEDDEIEAIAGGEWRTIRHIPPERIMTPNPKDLRGVESAVISDLEDLGEA